MRIVVTGRHGQVAQSLLERAAALNVDVHAVARPDIDLARPAELERALIDLAPEIIVNAAAYTAVDRAESEPDLAWRINALGAEATARAANSLGIPIIQLSTDYVFDGSLDRPIARMIRPARLAPMATASSGANAPLSLPPATTSFCAPPGSTVRSATILRARCWRWRASARPFPWSATNGARRPMRSISPTGLSPSRETCSIVPWRPNCGVSFTSPVAATPIGLALRRPSSRPPRQRAALQPASCRLRHRRSDRRAAAGQFPAGQQPAGPYPRGSVARWQHSLQRCIERPGGGAMMLVFTPRIPVPTGPSRARSRRRMA